MPARRPGSAPGWGWAVFFALCLVISGSAAAQSEDQSRERLLRLTSNAPDALVFVDSVLVGRARDGRFRLSADARLVRLTAPTLGAWSITPMVVDLGDFHSDTIATTIDFPYAYAINSTPLGATVLSGPSRSDTLGQTPLTVYRPDPIEERVVLKLDGYSEYTWEPTGSPWNSHFAALQPDNEESVPIHVVQQRPRRRWIDAVALGVAGVAATAAVHYKFKADRRYDVYAETGDPTLRPAIKRLDVQSGVALGVMQVGLGVVAVRLALK